MRELRKNVPLMLAIGALGWCVFLAFALVPVIRGAGRSTGIVRDPANPSVAYEVQAPLELRPVIALVVPVVLCSVAALAAYRNRRSPIAVATILLCAFVVITGFSIGLAYTPAAALMAWALLSSVARDTGPDRSAITKPLLPSGHSQPRP